MRATDICLRNVVVKCVWLIKLDIEIDSNKLTNFKLQLGQEGKSGKHKQIKVNILKKRDKKIKMRQIF